MEAKAAAVAPVAVVVAAVVALVPAGLVTLELRATQAVPEGRVATPAEPEGLEAIPAELGPERTTAVRAALAASVAPELSARRAITGKREPTEGQARPQW